MDDSEAVPSSSKKAKPNDDDEKPELPLTVIKREEPFLSDNNDDDGDDDSIYNSIITADDDNDDDDDYISDYDKNDTSGSEFGNYDEITIKNEPQDDDDDDDDKMSLSLPIAATVKIEENLDYDISYNKRVNWQDANDSKSIQTLPFTGKEELLLPVPGISNEPIDYFRHLMTDDFIELVIEQTNRCAVELLLSNYTTERSRITMWKPVTKDEILVFIGLILHMGIIKINRMHDYWRQDELFDFGAFYRNMSRNRFLLIQRCLQFAPNPDFDEQNSSSSTSKGTQKQPTDQLYQVRPLLTFFNQRTQDVFYPGRELTLDESMVLWRGKLTFRQCIKNKGNTYGIKLHMLTNPSGFILKFLIYTGMLKDEDSDDKDHEGKVALELLKEKLHVGHSVYMDNVYSSFELARKLLDNRTHCTGTLRTNRKHFPNSLKIAKLTTGETIAKYSDGIMIGKWKDQKEICYISTEHENKLVETKAKGRIKNGSKLKPLPLIEYNKFMSNIDRHNQMLSYHPCERKTLKWPTKIFVHMLQMMLMNSHYLYNKYSGNRKLFAFNFRISIIKDLLTHKKARNSIIQRPFALSDGLLSMGQNGEHVMTTRQRFNNSNQRVRRLRKNCKRCYEMGIRKDTLYVCTTCPNEPGYCLDCCNITHK